MATRKDRKSKTVPRSKQRESKFADYCTLPSEQERLPLRIPGAYQVATGTAEELVTWMGEVSDNEQAILIPFADEESYRRYGPIYWHAAQILPKIVARVQRRRIEKLVDVLTEILLEQPGVVSATLPGARVPPVKGAKPRRWRGMPNERKG